MDEITNTQEEQTLFVSDTCRHASFDCLMQIQEKFRDVLRSNETTKERRHHLYTDCATFAFTSSWHASAALATIEMAIKQTQENLAIKDQENSLQLKLKKDALAELYNKDVEKVY